MTVRDVMTEAVSVVRKTTPFKEIARVLTDQQVSALPVLDEDGTLVGVVSEGDLLAKEEHPAGSLTSMLAGRRRRTRRAKAVGDTAGAIMSSPALTLPPDLSVVEAARRLEHAGVKRMPVVTADGELVGILSRRDLVKVFLRDDDEIRDEVRREVFARLLWADPTLVEVTVRDGVVILSGEVEERSSIAVAVRLTKAVDGVVDVVDHLRYTVDDLGSRSDR